MFFDTWNVADACLWAVLGLYALLILADFVRPARAFETVRFWRMKGVLAFVIYFVIATNLPLVTDGFLAEHRVIDASGLGVAGGALVAFLVLELGVYAWHRALHRVPFLWRWHQMHHSAERVDVWGAMYFHPLDAAAFTLLGSVVLVGVVGVVPEAAVIAGSMAWALAIFQHANLRTPSWLGYLVARPESHSRHHERGVHASNYSDFPLWDIVFGTFENPREWNGQAGFHSGASERLFELLTGRDISAPRSLDRNERSADRAQLKTSTSRPSAEPISS